MKSACRKYYKYQKTSFSGEKEHLCINVVQIDEKENPACAIYCKDKLDGIDNSQKPIN